MEHMKVDNQLEFTYDEKCIFLAAMDKELSVCKRIDAEFGTEICLEEICNIILKKVKHSYLWGKANE